MSTDLITRRASSQMKHLHTKGLASSYTPFNATATEDLPMRLPQPLTSATPSLTYYNLKEQRTVIPARRRKTPFSMYNNNAGDKPYTDREGSTKIQIGNVSTSHNRKGQSGQGIPNILHH